MNNLMAPQLTRKTPPETKNKLLKIPISLYARMLKEAGLKWGDVHGFILNAIQEKLDREKEAGKSEKNKRPV